MLLFTKKKYFWKNIWEYCGNCVFVFPAWESSFLAHFSKEFQKFCEISLNFNLCISFRFWVNVISPHIPRNVPRRSVQKSHFWLIFIFLKKNNWQRSCKIFTFLQKCTTLTSNNFLQKYENPPEMRFLNRSHRDLSRNMWVDKVYSKMERDTKILNWAKFRKISEIPYQNEPKDCSLKLETQKHNFRNIPIFFSWIITHERSWGEN